MVSSMAWHCTLFSVASLDHNCFGCSRNLASRPEVIDSYRMQDPVQESQGQAEASTSGEQPNLHLH